MGLRVNPKLEYDPRLYGRDSPYERTVSPRDLLRVDDGVDEDE